jgi:hypothetical protein
MHRRLLTSTTVDMQGDPSLRLKNGSARDDADEKTRNPGTFVAPKGP